SAAIIGTSATIVPTPLGADNVAIASQFHMSVTDYVFQKHALISIPTLLAITIVHYLWQKYQDKKHPEELSYSSELSQNKEQDSTASPKVSYKGFKAFIYGLLPLLPIVILLIIFFTNIFLHTKLNISVQLVSLLSFVIAVLVEIFNKKHPQIVLKETSNFFEGMGSVMSIVALLVSAQVFVQGLTSIGIIDLIQKTMQTMNSSGIVLPVVMVVFTAIIVLLSGSGTALLYAMIPLLLPLSKAAGISPIALSVPMQLARNLLRAISPVAAVILIVAGTIKLSPVKIVKRTSVPMVFGVIMMLVMSLLIF
ncbi:MAG: C4-dicarboxylate transporter DcuC, partial [Pediococcus pentosaceus]|nr:C4-dicarboxylate transporter DcuC [Pediococcus pentosaceus]MCI1507190.1 C4-dicarboxylate transporter DcuC [Pediococcus pentosaceus]